MLLHRHVVIDVGPGFAPGPVAIAVRGQGLQGRPIKPVKELTPRLAAGGFHRPVEHASIPDPRVERRQREEGLVAQARQIQRSATRTPASAFALSGFAAARRNDDGAVVFGPLRVAALQPRLVPTRIPNAGAELIRHEHLRHAANVLDGVHVGEQMGRLLRGGRFGVGVADAGPATKSSTRIISPVVGWMRGAAACPSNRQTPSRRPCGPGASSHAAAPATVGSARRTPVPVGRPGGPPDTPGAATPA